MTHPNRWFDLARPILKLQSPVSHGTANSVRWGCRFLLMLLLVVASFASGPAFALDIIDARWGFDGKVALNRFNILSVLVQNATPQTYNGELVLTKAQGGGAATVDARVVEQVSVGALSPPTWVRFYVYIYGDSYSGTSAANETWVLHHRGGKAFEVAVPRVAKYQRVMLEERSTVRSMGGVFKRMPDELFPAFVTATDALQVLALDHEPRVWNGSQKEAFWDWLHLGGTVLILHGTNGRFPDFTGALAKLNTPLDETRFGSGRVIRVAKSGSQLGVDEARQILVGLPKNYVSKNATDYDKKDLDPIDQLSPSEETAVNQLQQQAEQYGQYGEGSDPFHSSSFLSSLKQMTKPEHNWLLLHFMFWVYIGMIFPGCYILGQKIPDFRIVYGGLLGTVALFSFLFSVVGQRGYGESTAVYSVSIARSLPDNALDVAGWSNVFVTSGADYDIKHNGKGGLYSAANQNEAVNGDVTNGAEARFKVDIPPFSNREFVHRVRLPTGCPKLAFESFKQVGDRLEEAVIRYEGLNKSDFNEGFLIVGNHVHSLSINEGTLEILSSLGELRGFLQLQQQQQWDYSYGRYGGYDPYGQHAKTPAERFKIMCIPLVSRSLGVARERDAVDFRVPPEMARVLIYANTPGEFAIQNMRLTRQEGKVLYQIDVPLILPKEPVP